MSLSIFSSDANSFNKAAPAYQKALDNSGYSYKLQYKPTARHPNSDTSPGRRQRKRNITWFNPPYSSHVKTNIGKKFLNLIDKCFPPDHHLHKLLNRNTLKLSYSTMPNMKQIITSHNKSVINKKPPEVSKPNCNCRNKSTCPLDGQCLTSGVIYQATVTRQDTQKTETYIGLTENTFKIRYNAHTNSFRHSNKRNATTLSNHIWTLKDENISYNLKWKIIAKAKAYSTSTKVCNLCIKEKYYIICQPQLASLNHRSELFSVCKHRHKHLLCNV